ncbi:MAG: hypothetical protein A3C12_00135 [Candidatus Sungbacteria bacterium RIFCSPHIGHO2_02_FULL_49_20]|uniref:Uncharacterized protein n=2 Tax=Candidatus Sungiibacteriota TaxID=1817917 RepID=A0A1G2KQ61_9BACT|nr:MAG: hypothetical protein A3C12_00135 [Candidatus Sungbacteria bacterium RIFCSPHIGHO2_02_FULL_49_20]
MTNLMRKILDAMSKVDTKQVLAGLAESKPGRDEKIVGAASEELIQLWGVVEQTHEELKQFARRGLHFLADADLSEMEALAKKTRPLMAESEEIRNREKAVKQLFWASVRADFPKALLAANIGIRKNGQIVTFDEDAPAALINVTEMRGLMDFLTPLR